MVYHQLFFINITATTAIYTRSIVGIVSCVKETASRYGCKLNGDTKVIISKVSSLEDANSSSISFLSNDKYKSLLEDTNAGAVILRNKDLDNCPTAAFIADDPYLVFARIASYFDKARDFEMG